MRPDLLLALNAAATLALVGLIWVVQLVIYPQFADVAAGNRGGFGIYHERYSRRITWLVGPLMGTELATGACLFAARPAAVSAGEATLGLALIAFNALSTGLWFAPLHARLGAGFDEARHASLVRTNWARTAAWTARGALVAVWIARSLDAAAR